MFGNRFINLFAVALLVVVLTFFAAGYRASISTASGGDQPGNAPGLSNAHLPVPTPGWRTPQDSKYYPPVIPTPGWRTPQDSKYYPPVIPAPGWRTPQDSKYYPPTIPTPGWRTPPTSNYVP